MLRACGGISSRVVTGQADHQAATSRSGRFGRRARSLALEPRRLRVALVEQDRATHDLHHVHARLVAQQRGYKCVFVCPDKVRRTDPVPACDS